MVPINDPPTIAEILAKMGYGHRRSPRAFYGEHEIYHIESGEIVGHHTAGEAIDAARAHAASRRAA